ncbi:hypothetical protein GLOTRDRAFT_124822 [Gloeophyllum trabeum ATCC 11539]|uniref:Uncharacterized protein n=1 Tax=Gloeophyllum trabeum (strain ATCC 11539 / FP-39264 / Madison 617) TaxID=670483 RepID=S7S125_GLOTA|nr:uncharacterized protein GLOTRDRAFT_124822 [Gloeophyllum trabeum ATCC 11539]EPQ61090.1 hypothetical protein GLOTRDRAFT_124822 [Gloeophyllum trabeum ATCC 11539]
MDCKMTLIVLEKTLASAEGKLSWAVCSNYLGRKYLQPDALTGSPRSDMTLAAWM